MKQQYLLSKAIIRNELVKTIWSICLFKLLIILPLIYSLIIIITFNNSGEKTLHFGRLLQNEVSTGSFSACFYANESIRFFRPFISHSLFKEIRAFLARGTVPDMCRSVGICYSYGWTSYIFDTLHFVWQRGDTGGGCDVSISN